MNAAVVAALVVVSGGASEAGMITRDAQAGPRMLVLPLFSQTDAESWVWVNGAQTVGAATHAEDRDETSSLTAFALILGVPGDAGWSSLDISPDAPIVPAVALAERSGLITDASVVSFGASLTERLSDRGLLGAMSILR